MRRYTPLIAVFAAGILLAVTCFAELWRPSPWDEQPERLAYQEAIDTSGIRYDASGIFLKDDRYWIDTDSRRRDCTYHCASATLTRNGAYQVHLPVGFMEDGSYQNMPPKLAPIERLVFWDPALHKKRAVVAKRGSVDAPRVLTSFMTVSQLSYFEAGTVPAAFIVRHNDGALYLTEDAVRQEPLGRWYGYTDQEAVIVRRPGGRIEVRLPEGYEPLLRPTIKGIRVTLY